MTQLNPANNQQKSTLSGLISLSRWKEQLPLATLTVLGALVAFSISDNSTRLDWRLFFVTAANFLAVTFAFMVNDIEDAEDDAKNFYSSKRNPISNGTLDIKTAWIASIIVAVLSFICYGIAALNNHLPVLIVGTINIILSLFYSWKPVRLKSSSYGLDIISHVLILSGMLLLTGYLTYSTEFHTAILMMFLACVLGSAYGQLYNQIRDFETDKEAGIMNITIRMGKPLTWIIAYSALAITIFCGFQAFAAMDYPSWLVWVVLGSSIFGFSYVWFYGNNVDASGKPAMDITGRLQIGVWFALAISVTLWVIWAMGYL